MMTRYIVLSLVAMLAGGAHAGANEPMPAVSIQLVLSQTKRHVVLSNSTTESITLYRSALSLIASGKTEPIPPFPKPFPPERPFELESGRSVTWRLVVVGNSLYPYTVDRGGIRLLGREHKVRAVYQHDAVGRIESNEATFSVE